MKRSLALAILTFSPIAILAQNQGAIDSVGSDTNKVQSPNISIKPVSKGKELFPQSDGVEVLEMKADSIYSNGLKPDEAKKIAKPKKKKGVKISSVDCPVT